MSDRELKLNSMSRYQKNSPQFILEAHDHCEVPAGCGGVVLRWWNPSQGVPVEIWVYAAGDCAFYLDGKLTESGCPTVSYGPHALAFRIATTDTTTGILMFAAFYEEKEGHTRRSHKTGISLSIQSAAGDGWKYTRSDPEGEPWMLPEYDDSRWREMIEAPVPKPEGWNYHYQRLIARKAGGLTVPPRSFWSRLTGQRTSADTIWVRKVFSL